MSLIPIAPLKRFSRAACIFSKMALPVTNGTVLYYLPKCHANVGALREPFRLEIIARKAGGSGPQPRRLRRRRRLQKEDPKLTRWRTYEDPFPFPERQQRLFREDGKHILRDVERLLLQSENKFALILEIAAEATEFLVNNPEEAIMKKPVLKAMSDRVNEAAGERVVADAYIDAVQDFVDDEGEHTLH